MAFQRRDPNKPPRQIVKPIPQAVPYDVIEATADLYLSPKSKLLYCWLYLTGQRISEALEVKRGDLTLADEDGENYFIVDSITEKNPHQPRRKIPVALNGIESTLANFVWDSVKDLRPELKIHYFSRQNAFNNLTKVSIPCDFMIESTKKRYSSRLSINPHYLRHCRATHLVDLYGYEKGRLERFMGWSSDKMANTYVSLDWRDLATGLKR